MRGWLMSSTRVELNQAEDGTLRLSIAGHDMTKHVSSEGFKIELDDQSLDYPRPVLSCRVYMDEVDFDLPDVEVDLTPVNQALDRIRLMHESRNGFCIECSGEDIASFVAHPCATIRALPKTPESAAPGKTTAGSG